MRLGWVLAACVLVAPGVSWAEDQKLIDSNVGTAPQDVLPPASDPNTRFAPPEPSAPEMSQLLISVDSQRDVKVKVINKDGEHACPEKVNRLKPCAVVLPPGHASIWLDNGIHTNVELPPGPTQVTLSQERWTLTIPGVVIMSAGLVLEIVGASADSMPLTVTGLAVMGVGAGVLLVGIFVPMDTVAIKHDEFENVAHTRGPAPMTSRPIGAALTLRF